MKARIIKENEFWYGEIFGTWKIPLLDYKHTGWKKVTPKCFTKLGAKYELRKWCYENIPDEFEI